MLGNPGNVCSWNRNQGIFCLWKWESWVLESGIQNPIPVIGNPQTVLDSRFHAVDSGLQVLDSGKLFTLDKCYSEINTVAEGFSRRLWYVRVLISL